MKEFLRAEPVRTAVSPRPLVQRSAGARRAPGMSDREGDRQLRRSAWTLQPERIPPIVGEVLRSPGTPLDPSTRAEFETRFGHDFGTVRVHTDRRAAESARAVDAQAYTVGADVVFDGGRYVPRSEEGRRLVAHELAHVVQQDGLTGAPERIGAPTDPLEAAADSASLGGEPGRGTAPTLQRQVRSSMPPWSSDEIGAGLFLPGSRCGVVANSDGSIVDENGMPSDLFSAHCPGQVCVNAPVGLKLSFYVDGDLRPRPQPFTPPRLAASVTFIASSGGTQTPIPSQTGTGVYQNPGWPLLPSFGDRILLVPSTPGILRISLAIADHDSGAVAVYSDDVPVVDCGIRPSPPPKIGVPSMRQPTGRYVFVDDPKGHPDRFRDITARLTDPGWDQPDKVFSVLHDEQGDYFMVGEQRIDVLPGER